MIKGECICKSYDGHKALKDVSIKVNKGSIYGLIGSNGAGKTTLLKILSGIYEEDSGNVLLDDLTVYENIETKSKLIFIPDTLYFFPQYRVIDMVKFYRRIYKSFDLERYNTLKSAFKIDDKNKINSLSKGMQRQVSFLLAICVKPEILILDEPLDGLDPIMRKKFKNLIIQEVADRKMTVLISSHNLRELEDFCDSIGIIHEGKLILQKDLDELKIGIHKIQVAFKGAVPKELFSNFEILYKENQGSIYSLIVKGDKQNIINTLDGENPILLDILPLTLEEIFIYEMGDVGYEIKNIILE